MTARPPPPSQEAVSLVSTRPSVLRGSEKQNLLFPLVQEEVGNDLLLFTGTFDRLRKHLQMFLTIRYHQMGSDLHRIVRHLCFTNVNSRVSCTEC